MTIEEMKAKVESMKAEIARIDKMLDSVRCAAVCRLENVSGAPFPPM